MENKIEEIINKLCSHELNKKEAKCEIELLLLTSNNSDKENNILNKAVSAIYFNDNSDYLKSLYGIVNYLTDDKIDLDKENMNKLYNILNKN